MIDMVDQMFDQTYRAGHAELNAALTSGLARLRQAVRGTFEILVRIEYDAPWAKRSDRVRSA